jgi:hypothetical protein
MASHENSALPGGDADETLTDPDPTQVSDGGDKSGGGSAVDAGTGSRTRRRAAVAGLSGPPLSLKSELHALRRSRIGAVAAFMTVAGLVVLAWRVFWAGFPDWHVAVIAGLRPVAPAVVTAIIYGPAALSRKQLRAVEFSFVAVVTLLQLVDGCLIDLHRLHAGDLPGAVVSIKNGVIQLVILMIVYGTFIPNDPFTVAEVVLGMSSALLLSAGIVMGQPGVPEMAGQLRTPELVGSNVLSVLAGAALAIYGAHKLNGLRIELHAAREFGQYQIVRKLGEGGMGEVYLAEHQLLKRPCALKLIRARTDRDPTALARFEREVRSAAQLSHPNSIEIFDYGLTEDGTFYYVMEYLRGMTVAELVGRFGTLPPGRLVYVMRQVCAGLGRAHALGLIHRDLKPSNIFVAVRGGESDVAKVIDFGLVKLTADPPPAVLSDDFEVSGTPLYMAPEQATGRPGQDGRVDLYALGAVMYYAATGRPPFERGSAEAVLLAHAREPVVPPSNLRPGFPDDLERVILKCLSKEPADRYPDARALSDALSVCECAVEWGPEQADRWWAGADPPVAGEGGISEPPTKPWSG